MSYQSLVERVLTPVGLSGENVIYLCPKCNDTSGHLYVNYVNGKYHCVRCGYLKGRTLSKLLKDLGIDTTFDYEELESNYDFRLDEVLKLEEESPKRTVNYSKSLAYLNSYYQQHITELSVQARLYLYQRGFTDSLIELFQLKEGLNRYGEVYTFGGKEFRGRDYSGRIMIPSLFPDGTISYYLGRDYTGLKSNKYSNAPQDLAYSSEDVWSLNIVNTEDVIICEGAFTAMSVNIACNNIMAVATYGKSIASKSNSDDPNLVVTSQGEKLLSRKFRTYYIFYDADVDIEKKISTCKYLQDRGANVKVVDIDTALIQKYGDKADANNMTREEVLKCLRDAKPFDRFYGIL